MIKGNFGVRSRLLSGISCKKKKRICLQKNKSKQSYVWIKSIFGAQNIFFGREIAGLDLGIIPVISAL